MVKNNGVPIVVGRALHRYTGGRVWSGHRGVRSFVGRMYAGNVQFVDAHLCTHGEG